LRAGAEENRMVSSLELFPTAATAAGAKLPTNLDGVDLLPQLMNPSPQPIRPQHYWRVGPQAAMRAGDWKIFRARGGDGSWQLYNLAEDIGEERDLAAQQPQKVAELARAWQKLDGEMIEPLWTQGGGGGKRAKK
jgi:arylsulfatase A-like enzyme